MRAIVLPEPWKAVTAEREIPVPKQGEALLKMVCGGICGSDLASYRGQSAYVSYPRTIGHEFAAEVVEVGENPYGIKKGMLVTGNPYFNCGTCYSCRRGYVNACIHNETMGVQREGATTSRCRSSGCLTAQGSIRRSWRSLSHSVSVTTVCPERN